MAGAVDATIEALVAHALEQRTEVLEQLVYAELERRVAEIVDQRLNGHSAPAVEDPPQAHQLPQEATGAPDRTSDTSQTSAGQTTKTCRVCGETKPQGKFDRGRRQCRTCRGRQESQRRRDRKASDDEEPHPVPTRVEKVARRERVSTGNGKGLGADRIERWLLESGFARRKGAGLQATEEGLTVGAALHSWA